jgi:formylglycine-generating enzyme required for sulfatase activity/murein DD-endopeptidase MepM/ murein hydrolase activator NlpD
MTRRQVLILLAAVCSCVLVEAATDGFDYPIGNGGLDAMGYPAPILEFPADSGFNESHNDAFPDLNGVLPSPLPAYTKNETGRADHWRDSGWYNFQDIGAYFAKYGGLHPGEDWNRAEGDTGQAVYAVANGTVIDIRIVNVTVGLNAWGWAIILKHELPNGTIYHSLYLHVTPSQTASGAANTAGDIIADKGVFTYQKGATVRRGDLLARIGAIDNPNHLHFEIRTNRLNLDSAPDLYPGDGAHGYYSGVATEEQNDGMEIPDVTNAFALMKEDGLEVDPSDFIDANRPSTGLPRVSNVQARQRAGTKLVDITYTLADADSATLAVTLAISSDSGATWTVPCTHATGKGIGPEVTPGTGKAIVWDAGADWNGQWSEHMGVRLTAEDGSADPAGDYLVIDVSGGPTATSYPVSYTSALSLLSDPAYKTTKIVLLRIPGTPPYVFAMGSPADELGRYSDEPQHQVTLTQEFCIGVFEVTQKQWERVMGNWPSYFSNTSVRDARPVEQVSYNDIRGSAAGTGWPTSNAVDVDSFIGRLRSKTNPPLANLDIPTEAQWEYACRAGTTTALNNGTNLVSTDSDPNMNLVGRYWYNGGSGYSSGAGLANGSAAAGTYLANAWGLYDMHGNVWEWCLDWYGPYPGTASDPRGVSSGSYRVRRGGCWYGNNAGHCRSASRSRDWPNNRYDFVGFRLALPTGR